MKAKTFKTREEAEKKLKFGEQYFVESELMPEIIKDKEVKEEKVKKVKK
jgi:hypothetical protein